MRFSRTDAGLQPPRRETVKMLEHRGVIVHHTAGNRPDHADDGARIWRKVQRFHQGNRGWNDIGYNWGFDDFGNVYEGRGWGIHGAHAGKYNRSYHGLVYLGFGSDPTPEALDALASLIAEHDELYGEGEVMGHRDVSTTKCPGDGLYGAMMERYGCRNPKAG